MSHRRDPKEEILGDEARVGLEALVKQDKVRSILAMDGDQCIGWGAVDPLNVQPGHDYNHWKYAETDAGTWSIHCLYIAPSHRGQGVSNGLIEHCIKLAKDQGAKRLLAFPIPKEMREKFPAHDGEFSGRYSSYVNLGFKKTARINDFYEVLSLDF
jgi:GNAT superfamily N-acetyltransferase